MFAADGAGNDSAGSVSEMPMLTLNVAEPAVSTGVRVALQFQRRVTFKRPVWPVSVASSATVVQPLASRSAARSSQRSA